MRTYQITMTLDVYDTRALRAAAQAKALTDGLSIKQWANMRKGNTVGSDILMLLDPGSSPDGTEIMDSSVESVS